MKNYFLMKVDSLDFIPILQVMASHLVLQKKIGNIYLIGQIKIIRYLSHVLDLGMKIQKLGHGMIKILSLEIMGYIMIKCLVRPLK